MTQNIGNTDRMIRFVLGIVLVVLAFVMGLTSWPGIVMLVVGILALATAAVRVCPLYLALGTSTKKA